ncbi:MAG TPA: gliding motility-associated C-terminal domain-containing protein, partial [Flavisolibacter sp.]
YKTHGMPYFRALTMKILLTALHLSLMALVMVLPVVSLTAQCVSSFPYSESFETSNGNWVPGGTASQWSWGTPVKPVINGAGGGAKCWITGTLTQSSYSNNQNSTLTSPCFDFTSVAAPYIRFKIFWETEKKYDGASFQYSTDGGTTWTNLGSYADYAACPSSNWFNTTGITALGGGSDGWSGNIQPTAPCAGGAGNGSGQWVEAQHEMASLAGKSNVRFRFRFAAGSVCNNYDGFAVDDIWIGEMPATSHDFTFSCAGSNSVAFQPLTAACNASYAWNFGDPVSGTANTSSAASPTHVFSGPGDFPVSLTITVPGAPPAVIVKSIRVIEVTTVLVDPVLCAGDKTATIRADVIPAGSYSYQWNTLPAQTTATASGLGAGSYSVQVSGGNACTAGDNITVAQPQPLDHTVTITDASCGAANGAANLQVSGGTGPYSYAWSPTAGTGSSAGALSPGAYSVEITDQNNCRDTASFVIANINNLSVSLGNDTVICQGTSLLLSPGNFASYSWQDLSSAPDFRVTVTGSYHVIVRDDNGCVASDTIHVIADCSDLFFPGAFTPDGDGRNDFFGALGNLAGVSEFSLQVFDRWGRLVFRSSNPYQKWDGGMHHGIRVSSSFAWVARYRLPGRSQPVQRKGMVTMIR